MKSKKGGKLHIVKVVVDEIRKSEGRFLQQVSKRKDQSVQSDAGGCDGITSDELEGCWVEIGDVKAMTKTSQAFRDLRPSKDTAAVSAAKASPTKPASTVLKVKNHVKEEASSDNKASIKTKSTNYGNIIDRKKDGNSIAKMIQLHKKKQLQQQRAKLKKGGKNIHHQQQQVPVLQATVESSSESESDSDEDSSSDSDEDRASSSSDEDEVVKVEPTARGVANGIAESHQQKEKGNPQCPSPDSTDPIDEERRLQQEKREKRLRLIALKQRTSLKSMTGKKPKALVPRKRTSGLPTASESNKKAATATSGTTKKRKLPKGSLATNTTTAGASPKKKKEMQEMDTPNTASTTVAGTNASGSSFSSLLAAVNKRVEEAKGQDDVSDTETEDSFPMYHESS